ncbi:hypothetical protein IJI72_03085 [Candidatus Saccharibacteria bacterium]|nr:hypothetical protein [Candidatus Saccharibacteria bacterium]
MYESQNPATSTTPADSTLLDRDNLNDAGDPLLTTDGTHAIILLATVFIAAVVIAYGGFALARLYPEEKPLAAFGGVSSETLETLPSLREAFQNASHTLLSGYIDHYRYLNVADESYVMIVFSPTEQGSTARTNDGYFLVFFSKYADVYPDILVLPEDFEVPSPLLTIETDGTYFTFPDPETAQP